MKFDALGKLRAAGHAVDLLSSAQQQVFAELSEPEVELLNRIKRRLDAVQPEVQGQELKVL